MSHEMHVQYSSVAFEGERTDRKKPLARRTHLPEVGTELAVWAHTLVRPLFSRFFGT